MSTGVYIALGAVGGFLAATFLRPSPGRCCDQLADLVRDDVEKRFGSLAAGVGDTLGLYQHASPLLDLTGVTR